MIHSGEGRTNGIRCRFNPSIGINFQGAKISSDTGILLLREIDERFGIISNFKWLLKDSRLVSHTRHSWIDLPRQRVHQNAAIKQCYRCRAEFWHVMGWNMRLQTTHMH